MARLTLTLLAVSVVLGACTDHVEATPAATISIEASTPTDVSTPSVSPSAPPRERYPHAVILIEKEPEVVFDWTTDKCATNHIPDLASRAIRDANGTVILFSAHTETRAQTGPTLDALSVDCDIRLSSRHSEKPSHVADAEWIASPFTEDGTTVYALVHNEYQGHMHAGRCPEAEYFPCWDNSITLAISYDGGQTFEHAGDDGDHLVARLPYRYEHGAGPMGYRAPSNIIQGPDGFYYAYFNVSNYRTQEQWMCAMRTNDLADPDSWRYWKDGNFVGIFLNPWSDEIVDPSASTCPPFEQEDIGHALGESVTWNEHAGRYLMVGLSADWIDDREVWGVYYSFSDDLIDWDRRQLLLETPLPWTVADGGSDESYLYPSLLDPQSTSWSFATTGEHAYLYLTRNNHGHASLDRDLIRYAITVVRDDPA